MQLIRGVFQVDILEQDAFEVLHLVRVWKNMLAPINKIPPEILTLIPDFWDMDGRDQDTITLTHVCRTWREVFVSRPSLWTDFDCLDEEKTRTYIECSKFSPISLNLVLEISEGILPCHPFFQIIPRATGRLESLLLRGTPGVLTEVVTNLRT